MTRRLYYDSSEIHEFDSVVEEVAPPSAEQSRPAVILRETAFYPTSGGQVHDTGWLTLEGAERLRVAEVADAEDGRILHYLEAPAKLPVAGARVRGSIDPERRRDHMQQHSGQHVLSAAFVELYHMPTVSFHMGEDYCSIDLATPSVSSEQIAGAEKRANEVVFENRPVRIRYVSRAEAEKLGLRKLPPAEHDELRLVEVDEFDLSACGGTHVDTTGQIGSILLRKTEKVRQGTRVEFVCGDRAVRMARRDYSALSEAAALFSAKLWDVPEHRGPTESGFRADSCRRCRYGGVAQAGFVVRRRARRWKPGLRAGWSPGELQCRAAFAEGGGYNRKLIPYGTQVFGKKVIGWRMASRPR